MTTGCTCSTPGCPGLAHERGGSCHGCQIGIPPRDADRTLRGIIHTALFGRDLTVDGLVSRAADREAGA